MKSYRFYLVVLLSALFILPALVVAQDQTWDDVIEEVVGDTAVVLPGFGTLNTAVDGDTTETGERVNEDRVYKLKRGAYYFLSGVIRASEYDLVLVGEKDDPAAPTFPAVVASGLAEDGDKAASELVRTDDDLTVKNFAMINYAPNGAQLARCTRLTGDSTTAIIDNMLIERTNWQTFAFYGQWHTVIATNSMWKNLGVNLWNGRALNWDGSGLGIEKLYVENCSFLNVNGLTIKPWENMTKLLWINHNTFVNGMRFPLMHREHINSYITNNIYHNMNLYGESEIEVVTNDYDPVPFGDINVDTITTRGVLEPWIGDSTAAFYEEAEAERRMLVHNNLWHHSEVFSNLLATFETDTTPSGWVEDPWMNSVTLSIFADDETWPHMVNGTLYNEEVMFTNEQTSRDSMMAYMMDQKTGAPELTMYHWDPDGDPLAVAWPPVEDLSYSNANLLDAAYGDLPLGDLNWFPAEKQAWMAIKDQETADFESMVQNGSTGVEDKVASPREFDLKQNYPNPFNPNTTIEFNLTKVNDVELGVYNMLGQKVKTLVNEQKIAGTHRVQWDGTNSFGQKVVSGVYFYKLKAGDHTQTMKMMLIK